MAEDSSSVELTAAEVTSALEEVDAIFGYLENYGKDMLEGDNFQGSGDADALDFEILTLENVAKVKG